MLADIPNSKFNMEVPHYRQERLFNEQGIRGKAPNVSADNVCRRKTIDNLEPVLDEVFRTPLINTEKVIRLCDEDSNKKAPDSRDNSFIIARIGVDYGSSEYSVFTFSDTEETRTIADLYDVYPGFMQTDGLFGYTFAEWKYSFMHLECTVHARSKAIKASEGRTKGVAIEMKKRYEKIFNVECEWEDLKGAVSNDFVKGRKSVLILLFEDIRSHQLLTLQI